MDIIISNNVPNVKNNTSLERNTVFTNNNLHYSKQKIEFSGLWKIFIQSGLWRNL